jgi:pimeloyl-ACP methyl ester carboxylesterase
MGEVERLGQRIHYADRGHGVAVLLGHSFLCSGDMWEHQTPALSRVARTINVDARGHGRSARATAPYTLYDMLEDMLAVLDHLGIERAVWAGLSMGGMVALRAALTVPDRVAGLIILDSDAGTDGASKRLRYRALGLAARVFGIRPVLPAVLRQMFGRTTIASRPELVERWRTRFLHVHVPSVLNGLGMLSGRDDVTGRLRQIAVPTLVIVGEEDRALPPAKSRAIAAGIPGARLVTVPGAGHLPCVERADLITDEMLAFLDELPTHANEERGS